MPATLPPLSVVVAQLSAAEHVRTRKLADLSANGPWAAHDEARADINEDRANDLALLLAVAGDAATSIDRMGGAFGDSATAWDVGPRCNCGEADALARVLLHGTDAENARRWLTGHTDSDSEDEGDEHYGRNLTDYLHDLAPHLSFGLTMGEASTNA